MTQPWCQASLARLKTNIGERDTFECLRRLLHAIPQALHPSACVPTSLVVEGSDHLYCTADCVSETSLSLFLLKLYCHSAVSTVAKQRAPDTVCGLSAAGEYPICGYLPRN